MRARGEKVVDGTDTYVDMKTDDLLLGDYTVHQWREIKNGEGEGEFVGEMRGKAAQGRDNRRQRCLQVLGCTHRMRMYVQVRCRGG